MKVRDKSMKDAVDALDSVTPMEWDALKSNDGTRYGHLAHPADNISKPKHYTSRGVEAIEIIKQQVDDYESYCEGNILKYALRYKDKNQPIDDLRKLRQYTNILIDYLVGEVSIEGE